VLGDAALVLGCWLVRVTLDRLQVIELRGQRAGPKHTDVRHATLHQLSTARGSASTRRAIVMPAAASSIMVSSARSSVSNC
jgi:hypothetical protein